MVKKWEKSCEKNFRWDEWRENGRP